jgi:2-methylisocitrate lyase-like PEP mutase family enzyme
MARTSFRRLLTENFPLVTPSAHDALSARLITAAGFKAIAIGGSSMLAAQYALPDIGLASLADMVDGARAVMRGTPLPCGMDADDGYGDVKSVVRTVRAYEDLGIGSLIFEDQLITRKQPGEGHAVPVIPVEQMERKLRAALSARRDRETLILARTDAYRVEGLRAALRRAERYLAAGADGIFVAGLQTPEELVRVGAALRGAIQIAVVTERLLPIWPGPTELYDLGFAQVVYPQFLIARASTSMIDALGKLSDVIDGSMPQASVPSLAAESDRLQQMVGLSDWTKVDECFG